MRLCADQYRRKADRAAGSLRADGWYFRELGDFWNIAHKAWSRTRARTMLLDTNRPALNGMGHLCAKQRATEGSCGERPPSGLVRTQSGRNLGIAVALAPEIPFGRELKV
jgi:hypothetical protein